MRLAEHLTRAEAYLEQGKAAEAVIEYRNALQIDPNRAETHWGLAKAHLAASAPGKAYWEVRETVRLDPANVEARLALGGFLLLGKKEELEGALEQADAVLARDAENADAYALRGRALERLQRFDKAEQALRSALELEPEEAERLRALAAFYVRRGDGPKAEPLLRRLVEQDPSFRSQAALAGFVARDEERVGEAEQLFQAALGRATEEERPVAYQLLASFLYAQERFDDAERTLQEGLEQTGGNLELRYALARFYHSRGDRKQADAMMEEATKVRPGEAEPYLILSAYRGSVGDLEGALAAAEKALAVDTRSKPARLRKAELLVDLGLRKSDRARLTQGRAIVDGVLAAEPGSPEALFVKAKLHLAEAELTEAIDALRRGLDARPDWAQAHFLLGSALFLSGDRQGARSEAQRALELDAQLLEARRLLARVNGSLGEHDLALEEARKVLAANPDDASMRILAAEALVRQGRAEEGLTELLEIPEKVRDAEAWFAIGRVHLFQGRLEAARAAFLAAVEKRPHHPAVLESLLEVEQRTGQLDASLARIAAAVKAEPESSRLVRLEGLALLVAGRPSEGEQRLRRAVELDPNDLGSHQTLARYYLASGRLEDSLAAYEKAIEARPDTASLHVTAGNLQELAGDLEKAIEHYEQAVRLDPDLAVAKNNLAYLLAEQDRSLDRALDLAQEAKESLPESPDVADTLGWVLLKKGVAQAAIDYLKEAEGGFPPGRAELGVVRHHLAQAYAANGEREKALATLDRALRDLDAQMEAARAEGGEPPSEPEWAGQARAMRERLRRRGSGASPAGS